MRDSQLMFCLFMVLCGDAGASAALAGVYNGGSLALIFGVAIGGSLAGAAVGFLGVIASKVAS